jgi:probable HAF family extracellular repeat protein
MRRVTIAILLCLAATPSVGAAGYRFTRIDVPGAVYTDARGINARGEVVGTYADADGVSHGFLLRKNVFSRIDFPTAAVTEGARAINARGDIVGLFTDERSVLHGFLYRDGVFTQIDHPSGSPTSVLGINNAGDLLGSSLDADGNESAFIVRNWSWQDFRPRVGRVVSTAAWSAQDNGEVVVGQAMRPDGGIHGYVRTRTGDFQHIDFPGLAVPCTVPRWINQRGDIVGLFAIVEAPEDCLGHPPHGFLLRAGQFTRIDFPGSAATTVFSINDDGVIVGRFTDWQGRRHGYVAVPR